jgi:hypothetical protein
MKYGVKKWENLQIWNIRSEWWCLVFDFVYLNYRNGLNEFLVIKNRIGLYVALFKYRVTLGQIN